MAGKVKVNGEVIKSPALSIDPALDKIVYEGKIVEPSTKVYYLLNKPAGHTSSASDSHAKKLVTELVPADPVVWPVGRLDRETSGLLILTNDGDLTQKLTHPSFEKRKTYIATVDKPLSDEQVTELSKGIALEDGVIKPDGLKPLSGGSYKITIHEGRNRLIRRMFEHFDRQVITLERTGLAFLNLGNLKSGEYRELTTTEISRLKNV